MAGLILTGEALLTYFGAAADKMDPLLRLAGIGVALFVAGYVLQPPKGA